VNSLTRLLNWARRGEQRNLQGSGGITLNDLLSLFTTYTSNTGKSVSPQSALGITAVYACVRNIAEDTATLPLITYRRLQRGKERAPDHPLYPLLHDMPNPEMTSVEFREALMGHVLTWGNGYAEIVWDAAGRVEELWPLRPDMVRPNRREGRLVYEVNVPNFQPGVLPASRVLHVRGLSYDGLKGYSPITLAKETLGLALASEEYSARFFANGAVPDIVLTAPKALSADAAKKLANSWQLLHGGLSMAHRIAVLEEGLSVEKVGIDPKDAMMIDAMKLTDERIAQLYRMPPHKIGILEHATFSNIEHQGIEYVTDTLRPWLVRLEKVIFRSLLTPAERQTYFVEHLVDGLLRGDAKTRAESLATQRQNGIISANEWRAIENMNPYEGGDEYLVNGALFGIKEASNAG
jgi:HK97 family phage portal protein